MAELTWDQAMAQYNPSGSSLNLLPGTTSTDTGLSVGGGQYITPAPDTSYSAPAADPYAQWGGKAGYDQAVADYGAQKNATYGSITDRENTEAGGYHSGILDFLDTVKSGQRKVNAAGVQNELAKRQGTSNVYDKVGRGLRSSGVMLTNKNSSNSSAGEAFARAYGDIGRRDLSGVNNQYEQGNSAIATSQADLNDQIAQGSRHLGENKDKIVNGIVTDAQNAISSLNAAAANASLPDRINIEAEKQRIRNEAIGKLQAFDAELSKGLADNGPASRDTNRGEAAKLATAGVAATKPFDFTTQTPVEFQNTGPFASDLPLFNVPFAKRQQIA